MRTTVLPRFVVVAALAASLLGSPRARAISREEVMIRAAAYAYHPWTCTAANTTASCDAGYQSAYVPGDYLGVPYDWGGYMTLFQFDQAINVQQLGAGSDYYEGPLSCTAGVDCSGYVTSVWGSGHYGTSTIFNVSSEILQADLLPGDAINDPGNHVVLFSHLLGNGDPAYYEALQFNVRLTTTGGWSALSGFQPIRYNNITGTTVGNPLGTPQNPIPIVLTGNTFSDTTRNTASSTSDVLDGCGEDPSKGESGPEYIYELTLTEPGQLTVAVADGVGVDVDVHLYTSMNTSDCIARDDVAFTEPVDCGTYYIVADTYSSGSTITPGPYQLTVTFAPSGLPCGSGPPQYDFEGELGDPCSFPGDETLPHCNPNLGAAICLYSSSPPSSFCSKPCTVNGDCTADFPGGCCGVVGSENYCFTADLCDPPITPDAGVSDGSVPPPDGGTPGSDGGSPVDGAQPGGDGSQNAADGGTTTPPDDGDGPGCSCRATGSGAGSGLLCVVGLLLWGVWRRRRWFRSPLSPR